MTIATGDSVTLEYTGRLDDETVFDTSRNPSPKKRASPKYPAREYAPLTVKVVTNRLSRGWRRD